MKRSLCAIALLGIGVVGCSGGSKTTGMTSNESVTDIAPPVATATPAWQAAPAPQPVMDTMAMSSPTGSSATGNGSYTVKKGDTLYGIARQRYGDGKQWQKIATANPGLSPQSLKVGQKIVIP